MGGVITWFDKTNTYHVLRFHAVTSESRTGTVTSSDHPVELGADITDFAKSDPVTASFTATVSQKPLDGRSLTRDGFNDGTLGVQLLRLPPYTPGLLAGGAFASLVRLVNPKPLQYSVSVLQFPIEVNQLEEVLKVLQKLQDEKQLVEAVTRPWSVDSALIVGVTPTRTAETGGGGDIQIEFKQMRRARVRQSAVPVPSQPKAKKKINLGNQQPPEAPVAKLKGSSFLKSFFGGL